MPATSPIAKAAPQIRRLIRFAIVALPWFSTSQFFGIISIYLLVIRSSICAALPASLNPCADIDPMMGPTNSLGQVGIVEHARDRVAGLAHAVPDGALRFGQAIFASSIRRLACAWHQCQRPVDIAHDLAEGDRLRRLGER